MLHQTDQSLMTFNNFGICDQLMVQSKDLGISRVRASFFAGDKTIESEEAEIGSYQHLATANPDYTEFLTNLLSKQQAGQEFQTLKKFDPNDGERNDIKFFSLSFGTSITWDVKGGSNFWSEFKDGYTSDFNFKPIKGHKLSIDVLSQGSSNTLISISCDMPSEKLTDSFEYKVKLT